MDYQEKLTGDGRELLINRKINPVEVLSVQSETMRLEKIDINDPALRPSNYEQAEGTPMRIFQGDGFGLDLSKRTKKAMSFWHRNLDYDEVIICFKGVIHWETELGPITLNPGELFLIPKGVAHRSFPDPDAQTENIILELKVKPPLKKVIP